EPFQKELSQVTVPAATDHLLFVLSGPTGARLPLGPGAVGTHDKNFYLTALPFSGRRAVGPIVLTAEPRRKAA
ncbi:MAG TPA: hypothetical protein VOA87_10555, partial [Thermoanaerobaculia bacterium]|nr:hypothetical protein [Thermoanaerobaculia bacterium]